MIFSLTPQETLPLHVQYLVLVNSKQLFLVRKQEGSQEVYISKGIKGKGSAVVDATKELVIGLVTKQPPVLLGGELIKVSKCRTLSMFLKLGI